MRKITSLFVLLLLFVAGSAQAFTSVTSLPTGQTSKMSYLLTTPRGSLFSDTNIEANYVTSNCQTGRNASVTITESDTRAQFLLFKATDVTNGYYIYSVGVGKFLGQPSGVRCPFVDTPEVLYIWATGVASGSVDNAYGTYYNPADYPFTIGSVDGSGTTGPYTTINVCCWDSSNPDYRFCSTDNYDAGNEFCISEAEEVSQTVYDAAYAKVVAYEAAAQSTLTWESRSGWVQASGGMADCLWIGATTPGSTITQFTLTEFQLWQESGGYGERYIAIATANATTSLNATDVVAVSNNCINPSASQLYTYTFDSEVTLNGGTTYYIVFLSSNTPTDGAYPVARGRLALNHKAYGAYTPGYRTSTGMQANWWPYYKAELTISDEERYESLLAQVEATNYGTVLGTYTCSLCPGTEADYINNIKTTYGAAANYADGATALQAMIDAISINLPKANTFLSIQSTHGTYLSGTASTSSNGAEGRLTFTTAEDASSTFFFDGTYLYCLGTGTAAKGREVGVVGTAGIAYTFEESTITAGSYAIRFNPDGGVNRFMYAHGTSGTKNNMADQNGSDAANCVFTLHELTSVPFTISDAGQATICLPVAFTVPTGVKVRYANRAHDGLLTVVECGTDEGVAALPVVPANTPVILVGAAGTYDLALATTDATVTGNVLTSTSNGGVAVAAETTAYILALNGTEVVFAKLDDTDRNIAGFKAYFVLTSGGDAPQYLFFEDGEVTGINSVNTNVLNGAAVYDLQGRRVNAATKGVYIVNGKKVLVK